MALARQDLSGLAASASLVAAGGSRLKQGAPDANAPWIEKFRPKTLDEVAAHTEIIDTSGCGAQGSLIRCWGSNDSPKATMGSLGGHPMRLNYTTGAHAMPAGYTTPPSASCAVKRWTAQNRLPHLLFYGPPGTGKTTTVLAIARQIYGPSMQASHAHRI